MKEKLLHYWIVYKKFVSTSVSVETSFRTSFILLVIMDAFFFFSSVGSVSFIYDHVATIGPWEKNELLFFLTFMLMIDNLHMMIFSQSFWEFSFNLKSGALDYVILKPMNTIFSVFFRHFRASSLFNTPLFLGFLIYYGYQIELGLLDWLLIPIFIVLGLSLLVILEFILSTSMFWLTDGIGINFLRMQMQQLGRWPNFIYQGFVRKVLTSFIPILLVGSAPVHFLIDKSSWGLLIAMVVAIFVLTLVLMSVWKLGLRRYDSASS
ncbi:MAG: ABC-2 family transporter protein [Halobacteriovoraceae bacterium]|nr:ABC-2 family transporter protein [Halobacteriovoraceae bacterium]